MRKRDAIVVIEVSGWAWGLFQQLRQIQPAFVCEQLARVPFRIALRMARPTATRCTKEQQDAKTLYRDFLPQGLKPDST